MPLNRLHHQHPQYSVRIDPRQNGQAPTKSIVLHQLLNQNREYNWPKANQRLGDAHHEHALLHEVRVERGVGHRDHEAESDALQQAVRDQELCYAAHEDGGQAAEEVEAGAHEPNEPDARLLDECVREEACNGKIFENLFQFPLLKRPRFKFDRM